MAAIDIEPSTLAIATFILALLISIAIFVWQQFSTSKGLRKSKASTKSKSISSAIALIGAPNSGKSALFARLTTRSFPALPTYSSMAPNQSPLSLTLDSPVVGTTRSTTPTPTLIDCPGHSRLLAETHKYLDRNPRLVLVTLDATALSTTKRDAAERLALALDHRVLPGMRVVVLATKADNPLAMPVSTVKATLAEELHVLRLAQEVQLGTTNDDDGGLSDGGEDENHGQLIKQLRVRKKGGLAGCDGKAEVEGGMGRKRQSLDDLEVKVVSVSAKSGKGIDELMAVMRETFGVSGTE